MSVSLRSIEGPPVLFPRGARRSWPWPHRTVFGLLLAVVALLVWREVEPLIRFRAVDGVVVDSDVEAVRVSDRGPHDRYSAGHTTRYLPSVTYSYVVGGESLNSAQYARFPMAGTHSQAQRTARRYVRGTRVQVWYNPSDPEDAVLSRSPNPVLIVVLAVVTFMMWLFTAAAVAMRRTRAANGG